MTAPFTVIEAEPLLMAIATPLPAAEDPRHGERFARIKAEIDKLSGTDFQEVRRLALELLGEEAKDLRVLGYLALAELYHDGLPGLRRVAEAYLAVFEQHWNSCHPRREGARRAALEWLNGPRFLAFCERAAGGASAADAQALAATLAQLSARAEALAGCAVWGELRKQLQARRVEAPVAAPVARAAAAAPTPAAPRSSVCSDADLQQLTRELIAYLRQQGDYLRMLGYARAWRWSVLALPPAQAGRTRVPAPRAAALAEAESARARGAWEDMLLAAEAAFLEPGGQFCLCLQQQAHEAATGMGRRDLADAVAGELRLLLARLPGLTELCFDDGSPFADADCRVWVESLQPRPAEPVLVGGSDEALGELLGEARTALQSRGLAAALGLLAAAPAPSGQRRARMKLAQAQLCLEQGRPELALPVLEALAEQIECVALPDWDPGFALEVWQPLARALKAAKGRARSGAMAERLKSLQDEICRADLSAAAALL